MRSNCNSAIKVISAVVSVVLSAQLTVDIGSIPITGQTLAILIWAFFLTPSQAFVSLSLYILMGIGGLPVFADGSSGIDKLTGGSGGFIVGFVVAATWVSHLYKNRKSTDLTTILMLTALGTLVILIFGIGRLFSIHGLGNALKYGFYPFWKGALLKIVLGSFVVWGIKRGLKAFS